MTPEADPAPPTRTKLVLWIILCTAAALLLLCVVVGVVAPVLIWLLSSRGAVRPGPVNTSASVTEESSSSR
jgi:hypothetical protein